MHCPTSVCRAEALPHVRTPESYVGAGLQPLQESEAVLNDAKRSSPEGLPHVRTAESYVGQGFSPQESEAVLYDAERSGP
jgi:hypothetical protein